jgi:hypothetical protein
METGENSFMPLSLLPQAKGGREYQQLPPRVGQMHQGNQVRSH